MWVASTGICVIARDVTSGRTCRAEDLTIVDHYRYEEVTPALDWDTYPGGSKNGYRRLVGALPGAM